MNKQQLHRLGSLALAAVGLLASAAQAEERSEECKHTRSFFIDASFDHVGCDFSNFATIYASSLSGYHAPGQKGIIASLDALAAPANSSFEVFAQGLSSNGTPISTCKTGVATFPDGNTVGDGSGCQNAQQHQLVIRMWTW